MPSAFWNQRPAWWLWGRRSYRPNSMDGTGKERRRSGKHCGKDSRPCTNAIRKTCILHGSTEIREIRGTSSGVGRGERYFPPSANAACAAARRAIGSRYGEHDT